MHTTECSYRACVGWLGVQFGKPIENTNFKLPGVGTIIAFNKESCSSPITPTQPN